MPWSAWQTRRRVGVAERRRMRRGRRARRRRRRARPRAAVGRAGRARSGQADAGDELGRRSCRAAGAAVAELRLEVGDVVAAEESAHLPTTTGSGGVVHTSTTERLMISSRGREWPFSWRGVPSARGSSGFSSRRPTRGRAPRLCRGRDVRGRATAPSLFGLFRRPSRKDARAFAVVSPWASWARAEEVERLGRPRRPVGCASAPGCGCLGEVEAL